MDLDPGSKSVTVYLARHGETVGNIQRVVLLPENDVLSDIGKNQAQLLAETLKDVRFTKVYSSGYPRTKETASIILDTNIHPFPKADIKVDTNLREIDLDGIYGKPYSFLLGELVNFLNSGKPIDEIIIDDSEPIPKLSQRANEAIKTILEDALASPKLEERILIVSHGACIRMIMLGLNESQGFERTGWDPSGGKIVRNTGYMKFVAKESGGKIHIHFQKFHETSHFPKEMLETDSLTKLANTPEGKCLSGCFQV